MLAAIFIILGYLVIAGITAGILLATIMDDGTAICLGLVWPVSIPMIIVFFIISFIAFCLAEFIDDIKDDIKTKALIRRNKE